MTQGSDIASVRMEPHRLVSIRETCLDLLALTQEASKLRLQEGELVEITPAFAFNNSMAKLGMHADYLRMFHKPSGEMLTEILNADKLEQALDQDTLSQLRGAAERGDNFFAAQDPRSVGLAPPTVTDDKLITVLKEGLHACAVKRSQATLAAAAAQRRHAEIVRQLALIHAYIKVEGEAACRAIREVTSSGFTTSEPDNFDSIAVTTFPFIKIDLDKVQFLKEAQLDQPKTVMQTQVQAYVAQPTKEQLDVMVEAAKEADYVLVKGWEEMKEISDIQGTVITLENKDNDPNYVQEVDLASVLPQNIKFMKKQYVEMTFAVNEETADALEADATLGQRETTTQKGQEQLLPPEVVAIDILNELVNNSKAYITTKQDKQADYLVQLNGFHVQVSNALHHVYSAMGIHAANGMVSYEAFSWEMCQRANNEGYPLAVCEALQKLITAVYRMFPPKTDGYKFSDFSQIVDGLINTTRRLRVELLKAKETKPEESTLEKTAQPQIPPLRQLADSAELALSHPHLRAINNVLYITSNPLAVADSPADQKAALFKALTELCNQMSFQTDFMSEISSGTVATVGELFTMADSRFTELMKAMPHSLIERLFALIQKAGQVRSSGSTEAWHQARGATVDLRNEWLDTRTTLLK